MNLKRFASIPADLNTKFVILKLELSEDRMAIEVHQSELCRPNGEDWLFRGMGSALVNKTELGEVRMQSCGWTSFKGHIIDYASRKEEAIQTARMFLEQRKDEILMYLEGQKNKFKAFEGALVIE